MVESQGLKRQDTVFALSCNKIDEIYPWSDIPQGVLDLEREDCYYTNMFDPIMDTNISYTCSPKEYLAGITRVTDTRIQTMCCRLRTRDEANCENVRFGKPLGYDGKVEIQLKGKLINALTVEKNLYNVRFCDLVPRAIGAILNDIKTTTARPSTTTTSTTKQTTTTTSMPLTTTIISNQLTEDQIKEKTVTDNIETLQSTLLSSESSDNEVAEQEIGENAQIEELKFASNQDPQESEMLESSIDLTNENVTETSDSQMIASKEVSSSAEEKVLSPLPIQQQNTSVSMEVQASPMPQENIFPSDKDYENIEEAEAELMTTIAEMIKARNIAKNIISKVKSAGVKQLVKEKQEEMAEQLLREIEGQTDPAKADELFKQSIEMLNELSEAKQIMSTEEFSKEMMRQEDKKAEESASKMKVLPAEIFKEEALWKSTSEEKEPFETPSTEVQHSVTSSSKERDIITSTLPPQTSTASSTTTATTFYFTKPLHTTILPFYTTKMPFTDISQSLEDVFEYAKSKSLFFKKHEKKSFLKPSIENGPSKEVLFAASSSNEARRAPAKHFTEPYPTLPPLNNFPSPPSQTRHRPRPLELPRIPKSQENEEYQPPIIELDEYDELLRSTTPYPYFYKSYKKHTTIPHLAPNARGNFVDQPYVDELTRLSPFETSYENRILPSIKPRHRITTTPEPTTPEIFVEETTEYVPPIIYETSPTFKVFPHDKSPFDYPEIRRAPIPRRIAYDEYKNELQKNQPYMDKIALDSILSKTAEVQTQTINVASKEGDQIDKNDGEGVMSFKPVNNKEMEIEKAEVLVNDDEKQGEEAEYQNEQDIESHGNQDVETLVPMNAIEEGSRSHEENVTETKHEEITTTTSESSTTTTKNPSISSTTSSAVTESEPQQEEFYAQEYQDIEPEPPTYDPRAFYHTLPPRPIVKKERYLTFCTKDLAIRDSNNMIVACGSDNEVWIPKRCPDGTDCFYTTDSTFRICCPVAEG
uniref:WxxW domain-containing protein n=1 Tax=Panagrolaimus sp. PS1159 TaxID=55785 RepID=A0AC35G157_9BILA